MRGWAVVVIIITSHKQAVAKYVNPKAVLFYLKKPQGKLLCKGEVLSRKIVEAGFPYLVGGIHSQKLWEFYL